MATRTIENKRDRICDDPDCAVHDLFGAAAHLHPADCGLYSDRRSSRIFWSRACAMLSLYVLRISCGYLTANCSVVVLKRRRLPSYWSFRSTGPRPALDWARLLIAARSLCGRRARSFWRFSSGLGLTTCHCTTAAFRYWSTARSPTLGTGLSRDPSAGLQFGKSGSASDLGHRARGDCRNPGTIYGVDPATHSLTLQNALHQDLTFAGAMALLVFFAFAMQCTSTLAVVRRETNSWKWPVVQFVLHDDGCVCSPPWSSIRVCRCWSSEVRLWHGDGRRGRYFFRSLLLPFYFFPKNFPNPSRTWTVFSPGFSLVNPASEMCR